MIERRWAGSKSAPAAAPVACTLLAALCICVLAQPSLPPLLCAFVDMAMLSHAQQTPWPPLLHPRNPLSTSCRGFASRKKPPYLFCSLSCASVDLPRAAAVTCRPAAPAAGPSLHSRHPRRPHRHHHHHHYRRSARCCCASSPGWVLTISWRTLRGGGTSPRMRCRSTHGWMPR